MLLTACPVSSKVNNVATSSESIGSFFLCIFGRQMAQKCLAVNSLNCFLHLGGTRFFFRLPLTSDECRKVLTNLEVGKEWKQFLYSRSDIACKMWTIFWSQHLETLDQFFFELLSSIFESKWTASFHGSDTNMHTLMKEVHWGHGTTHSGVCGSYRLCPV